MLGRAGNGEIGQCDVVPAELEISDFGRAFDEAVRLARQEIEFPCASEDEATEILGLDDLFVRIKNADRRVVAGVDTGSPKSGPATESIIQESPNGAE